MTPSSVSEAEREKNSAALSSVIAAICLTTFKIIVGVMTGSLGILSEAAHSGLDLVAALITFFAVRVSDKPADAKHHYGHGKIENFSALIETLLLLATSAWIIYEAYQRLFVEHVKVDASIWAFIVMIVSIGIDFSRSRVLDRAAKKYKSQALEADALHFSTDIWSSSVVIIGLICIKLSELIPSLSFLQQADAIAAVVVALIVIVVSIQLGKRTVDALLDTAPHGLADEIERTVEAMPGVVDGHAVRVRHAGPHTFVDLHILVDGKLPLDEAHALTEKVEEVVRHIAHNADVNVHAEPAPVDAAGLGKVQAKSKTQGKTSRSPASKQQEKG